MTSMNSLGFFNVCVCSDRNNSINRHVWPPPIVAMNIQSSFLNRYTKGTQTNSEIHPLKHYKFNIFCFQSEFCWVLSIAPLQLLVDVKKAVDGSIFLRYLTMLTSSKYFWY